MHPLEMPTILKNNKKEKILTLVPKGICCRKCNKLKKLFLPLFRGRVDFYAFSVRTKRRKSAIGQILKAPPVNPRDYISQTSKISPREGH